nr:hypothetical protein [Spiroplasma sp. Moj]
MFLNNMKIKMHKNEIKIKMKMVLKIIRLLVSLNSLIKTNKNYNQNKLKEEKIFLKFYKNKTKNK